MFDPKKFVDSKIEEMRNNINGERTLVAVSGGVDSTTCAVLTHKAIGENLVCICLDHAFMRRGEPEQVAKILSKEPIKMTVKVVDVSERFLEALKDVRDSEEKRKIFRETFYRVLSEVAKKEECKKLVQGTIRADVLETVGGVKTQHNVLEQIGINPMEQYGFKVVEPLKTLYKDQVRIVAKFLGLPSEISERQPFPGPGLSVRVVGKIRKDKLEILKKATDIVEAELKKHKPSQYFAIIIDNKESLEGLENANIKEKASHIFNIPLENIQIKNFKDRATGIKKDKRLYGKIVGIKIKNLDGELLQASYQKLVSFQKKVIENSTITRLLYSIKDLQEKKDYVIGIRSVQTKKFLTAKISEIPWKTLVKISEKVTNKCRQVSTVYYDITSKPPATIEME